MNGLWNRFRGREVSSPRDGCMVFWFKGNRAYHVAIAIDEEFCFTADGGGSRVKTIADAWKYNAFIKTRPILGVRSTLPRFVDIFVAH